MKLNSWRGIGSDGDVLLTPYVPEGITGYDDDDDDFLTNCASFKERNSRLDEIIRLLPVCAHFNY